MRLKRVTALALGASLLLASLAFLPGCGGGGGKQPKTEVVLATSSAPYDTGLLAEWVPMFEARYPYTVRVVPVGSGMAILTARDGECDVTLTNSPVDEQWVTGNALEINKKNVMHNQFVIVGPANDPAGIRGMQDAMQAFRKINDSEAAFFSRGEGSGTHTTELSIWQSILGFSEPVGSWYLKSGKGMGDTLILAGDRRAYALTDKATYLVYKDRIGLEIMLEGDERLANQYVVMEVNPAAFPDVNSGGAQAFSEFVTSLEAQEFLNVFGVEEYGEQLFYPDAL